MRMWLALADQRRMFLDPHARHVGPRTAPTFYLDAGESQEERRLDERVEMTPAIRLLALAALTGVLFAQGTGKIPATGNASIETAMDEARDALKSYHAALVSVRDLPGIDATVRGDSQIVLSSRNTVAWLRSKVDLEDTVVPSEFEGLVDSLDECATHAALSASVLAAGAARTGHERELQAAMHLVSASEQLRKATNHLRRSLRPYLLSETPAPNV
jgi:hypothetical protein